MATSQTLSRQQATTIVGGHAKSITKIPTRVASHGHAHLAGKPLAQTRRSRTTMAPLNVIQSSVPFLSKVPASDLKAEESRTDNILSIILGGGAGTRLYPLTRNRAKPAVPIGGAYRLIDVPMSNCINSGINRIYILTQFNSTSLNRHLQRAYNFSPGISTGQGQFVEVLAANQTPDDMTWFQGTADAVRQYSWLLDDIKNRKTEDVVILSGDHLYRMDYLKFVIAHRQAGADITIGAIPCGYERASDFGLMKTRPEEVNGRQYERIVGFAEKPKGEALEAMKVNDSEKPFLASMGIYVFKRKALLELLNKEYPQATDFGGEIIPSAAAANKKVYAYRFDGYWEDIGTIASFFEENLKLTEAVPEFEFYDPTSPIYTSQRQLPPALIKNSEITQAIIAHGASISNASIKRAIIGIRSAVRDGSVIEDAMLMGSDFYESDAEAAKLRAAGGVPMGIGERCVIKNAIVDKNARIGNDVQILNQDGVQEADRSQQGYMIRSGIVCVFKGATIKDGTRI